MNEINVAFIAKNIPIPNFTENDIVLKQHILLNANNIKTNVFYPREYIPKLPFLLKGRAKALSILDDVFYHGEVEVQSIYYLRVPFKSQEWKWVEKSVVKLNALPLLSDVNIIHSHYIFPDGIIGNLLATKYNIKHVITLREGDFINISKSDCNLAIFLENLKLCDAIVALTHCIYDKIPLEYQEKTTIIPSFIHNDFFTTPHSLKKENSKAKVITIISNFIERKNISWLINFVISNPSQHLILNIIGSGHLESELKALAGNDSRIFFLGRLSRNKIIYYLDISDIFTLPSDSETFGLVYAEASARKNIIIGKKSTGLSGIKNKGFYFISTYHEMNELLLNLLSLNDDEMNLLKESSFELSVLFSEDNHLDKLKSLYKSLT
jgi:glycosyltransferase involved in cell wall biosynthesis